MLRPLTLIVVLLGACGIVRAQWQPVPPMDWSSVKPSDFSDRELEIPFLLHHFHRVANAVVEHGDNRGWLDIAVARDAKDNKPYNARIMENHLALAFFYTTDRPWNPYRGSDAVRQRLEAMLQFWLTLHNPEGLLPEYAEDNYNLAATGFGVMFMSQTLELLHREGVAFDADLLKRVVAAQRKSILAILTDARMLQLAKEYSNQFSGVYPAAMSYLQLYPDDREVRTALQKATSERLPQLQSPAGYWYEAGGPDAGYSGVHEMVMRMSVDYLGKPEFAYLKQAHDRAHEKYERWLSYNFVIQPDRQSYIVNAGPLTRTSMWRFTFSDRRPHAERVEVARAFSITDTERQAAVADARQKLERDWGKWGELRVPSQSYIPTMFQSAMRNLDPYYPTAAERAAAIATLPYLASDNFNFQAADPRPMVHTFVRRPGYYASFNSGRIRQPTRQHYGIGFVWHPQFGAAILSVGGTELAWGTKPANAERPYERGADVDASINVGGAILRILPGMRDLPGGNVTFTYPLGDHGRKTVLMHAGGIDVTIEHPGAFDEQIPLLHDESERPTVAQNAVVVERNGVRCTIEFASGEKPVVRDAGKPNAGLAHSLATVRGSGRLSYTIRFSQ